MSTFARFNEGMHIQHNYDNDVTKAIDAQPVFAPQYGIVGTPPKFDPPTPKRRKYSDKRSKERRALALVRRQTTRDIKLCIAILEAELKLAELGQLELRENVLEAMKARLRLFKDEKVRRDLRDLAKGKTAPARSFYSLGARVRHAA